MTADQTKYTKIVRIAAELPYTGYSTLTIFDDGSWISPSDAGRIERRGECFLFSWQRDETGDYGYAPARRHPA